jgi:hypothetical protein
VRRAGAGAWRAPWGGSALRLKLKRGALGGENLNRKRLRAGVLGHAGYQRQSAPASEPDEAFATFADVADCQTFTFRGRRSFGPRAYLCVRLSSPPASYAWPAP